MKKAIKAVAVAVLKGATIAAMGLVASGVLYWAFTHDETNIAAQAKWSEQAKELDQKIEFQKTHPEAQVFE
jgi:hypothetical protein